MNQSTYQVPKFAPLHGWANRLLRIDLGNRTVQAEPIEAYVPDYLGGRGLAARVLWEEYPEPVDPFDPRCPLMVFAGALTGSRSPYSGRASISTFSPQAYPYHWFTRSSIGGHLGGELKRAGYDGLIITGSSETPVRLAIEDDTVRLVPADDLWGLGTLDAIEALRAAEGGGVRALVIGPAGENLSHIATIHTASSSACGHGGFGAVMGAKKLKAISVKGSGKVSLVDVDTVTRIAKAVRDEGFPFPSVLPTAEQMNKRLAAAGGGRARPYACTESCVTPCGLYYEDMPGQVHARTWRGHWFCVAPAFEGFKGIGPLSLPDLFDWQLGLHAGFEVNAVSNAYGINQWELVLGMVPWLSACQEAGLISEINGRAMDWRSADFWDVFLHAVAYREGIGDALSDGGWAAARSLSLGEGLMRRHYTGWGFAGHWDGHGDCINRFVFPFWLVTALQWLTDTRDPIPSGHGYCHGVMRGGPWGEHGAPDRPNPITWDHMRAIASRIYRDAAALDPYSGYEAKAYPAFYHTRRSVIKDSVPVGDFVFPMIYSPNTEDHLFRIGEIEGPSIEYHLFRAGTGTAWSEEEFDLAAERIYTLERASTVRHWARNRAMDETVLPSFEYIENWKNPLREERYALDRGAFGPVMDEYYALQGWDPKTGWPTRERLEGLGLAGVYDAMVAGAVAARERLPEPPGPGAAPEVERQLV